MGPPLAVVTGANSGVGFETTRRLAGAGWSVVMLSRSRERGEEARDRITAEREGDGSAPGSSELELADLSVLADVDEAATGILSRHPSLDALVLNAGVYEETLRRTTEGFERTMAVNHLAHVLLTVRLLPALAAAGGRVVCVTSGAHHRADLRRASLEDVMRGNAWKGGLTAYGDSKLANVLFAFELDRRLRSRGIRADAVHPGVLATRIWDRATGLKGVLARVWRLFMEPAERGGEAVARPLLDPELRPGGGRYFDRTAEASPSPAGRDSDLAARLWDVSLDLLGVGRDPLDEEGPTGKAAGGDPGGA